MKIKTIVTAAVALLAAAPVVAAEIKVLASTGER
jgi:hypothetical protein